MLVLQYAMPLGCGVHGTPLYAALKNADPGLVIVVASRSVGLATVAHDPNVDVLLETADPMASLGSLWSVAADIRRQLKLRGLQPVRVLQDVNNRRGRFALFAAALRLAPTVGFADASGLYDIHLTADARFSLIDNNLRLAATLAASGEHLEPAVYFTAAELSRARELVADEAEAAIPEQPVVAFAVQGSGGQPTAWLRERFAAVVAHVERMGCRTIFVGTAADVPAIEEVLALAGSPGRNLAGKTSIPELAAVLCLSDLLVSIDTGSMHVGRAAGVPLVVLGTCWQEPTEWLPVEVNSARILRAEGVYAAPADYHLVEIEVPAVVTAGGLLRQYPSSCEAREARVQRLLSSTRA